MFVTTLRCKLSSNFRILIYDGLITDIAASDMSDQSFVYFKLQSDGWNAFSVSEELLNNFSFYSSRLIASHRGSWVWLPTSVEFFGIHQQLILHFCLLILFICSAGLRWMLCEDCNAQKGSIDTILQCVIKDSEQLSFILWADSFCVCHGFKF